LNEHVVVLRPGARLVCDGDVVEVTELDGSTVTIRNERTGQFRVMGLSQLVSAARGPSATQPLQVESLGVKLARLTNDQLAEVAERAAHVREVLTGDRAGDPGAHPDAARAAGTSFGGRLHAKAVELGVTDRTVERWVSAYRKDGEAGLVDSRTIRGRGAGIDGRWDDMLRLVLSEMVEASTPSQAAVLATVEARLDESGGRDVVPRPSRATAYRRLAQLSKGTNAVRGQCEGPPVDRRSAAGRLRPVAGEPPG